MTVILPDCVCGGRVVLEVDHYPAREVCRDCGLAQPPVPVLDQAAARERVHRYRALLAPACKRGRCDLCQASGCEHWCHGEVRGAAS